MKMRVIYFLNFIVILASSCVSAQFHFFPSLFERDDDLDKSSECTCDLTSDEYEPICGSDHFTYSNPSDFYCVKKCQDPNLSIRHNGRCEDENDSDKNSDIYSRSKFQPDYKILNKCSCSTNSEYNPVCGSNGITYDNPSLLQCDKKCKQPKLKIARFGLCREEEYFNDLPFLNDAVRRCSCSHTYEDDPVCGTDGYTYPNPSALRCVTSCNNPSLRIVHYGMCKDQQKPHNLGSVRCRCVATSENYHPVCADNGVTYDNLSLFYCAQKCWKTGLRVISEYPCRDRLDLDDRNN